MLKAGNASCQRIWQEALYREYRLRLHHRSLLGYQGQIGAHVKSIGHVDDDGLPEILRQ